MSNRRRGSIGFDICGTSEAPQLPLEKIAAAVYWIQVLRAPVDNP
jgi:hypothetical protein